VINAFSIMGIVMAIYAVVREGEGERERERGRGGNRGREGESE
jgi:hypothetical protein